MPRRSDETKVSNDIQLSLLGEPVRLLRNNVGGLKDVTGRFVAYGLGSHGGHILRGPSDLIGWRTVTVTPDMVGSQVAIFAAIEVKDKSKASLEQEQFIAQVRQSGGLAGVAHSAEEARTILGM